MWTLFVVLMDSGSLGRAADARSGASPLSCARAVAFLDRQTYNIFEPTYWFLRLKRPRDLCLRFEPVAFEPSDAAQVGGASAGTELESSSRAVRQSLSSLLR